ncbi:glycoside hydrolase [Tenacibaculum singaporense]|uniref:Glycoside hydrolase n=1 Tax=Tenacibaculum singaporense TaxID=2358479 RepID=A0A3Q8RLG5_9FLAO|nr:glycoside hydrolase [Tenacibaculum singaporense]AZJ34283.1 glycoside hydrolase [Tenacibaculum singaporense]
MKTLKLLLVSFILFMGSCTSQSKKINGVSFVASSKEITNQHIDDVKKVSANYVTLMPFGFVKNLSSPNVIYNSKKQWFGETKEGVKQYAKEFQQSKIKIMLKPQIWVWNGVYTGSIKMNSEDEWRKLERSYEDFILAFAKVAEEINAEIFCIGTELEQFVKNRPEYWKKLIKKIRKVYFGKLTYAANWDEFKRVDFWEDLDFIGIDAYFPLSDQKSPTLKDFEKGWQPHKNEVIQVQSKFNKPVLFTEYGYRSVNFTGKEPWNSGRIEGDVNLENQQKALQALYNQFWKEDWFAGGFVWKWFHNHKEVGGEDNNRFTPQNKPAELTIKKMYENSK